jgi:hypothetical protein
VLIGFIQKAKITAWHGSHSSTIWDHSVRPKLFFVVKTGAQVFLVFVLRGQILEQVSDNILLTGSENLSISTLTISTKLLKAHLHYNGHPSADFSL